jgi:hypothetical protein
MVTNNAVNLSAAGITGYNGTGTFVGNPTSTHNLLVGGVSSDSIVNVPPSATVGFVLTSNGVSADPSFQSVSPGASVTFTGDTGTPFSTSAVTIYTNNVANDSGSSVSFDATTPNMTLTLTDINSNVLIGNAAGNATVSGTDNVGLGQSCLSNLSGGTGNTAIGAVSGNALVGGSGNVLIGDSAGQNYTGSESFNIILGVNAGTVGESNVLRLGGGTGTGSFQQNLSFISGVTGSIPIDANSPQVVLADSTDNFTVVSDATAGFILTSNSPNAPTFQAPASSAITFSNVGSPTTAVANNGYFVTSSTTITLPASPPMGTFVIIYNEPTIIVTVTANTGQTIRLNNSVSSSGGTATNVTNGSSITLYYRSNSLQWSIGAVVGSWTIA